MSRSLHLAAVLGVALLVAGPLSARTELLTPDAAFEAEATVQRYLQAVLDGDRDQIRSLTRGEMRRSRAKALENPEFSRHLQDTYRNATFEVGSAESGPDGGVRVPAKIVLGDGEVRRLRYVLRAVDNPRENGLRYRIWSEETPVFSDLH